LPLPNNAARTWLLEKAQVEAPVEAPVELSDTDRAILEFCKDKPTITTLGPRLDLTLGLNRWARVIRFVTFGSSFSPEKAYDHTPFRHREGITMQTEFDQGRLISTMAFARRHDPDRFGSTWTTKVGPASRI